MSADPRRILASIRDELRAASAVSDGYYIDVGIDPRPLTSPDGSINKAVLDAIDAGVMDGRQIAMECDWGQGDDRWTHELYLSRWRGTNAFVDVYNEYAPAIVHCLCAMPNVREAYSLGETDRFDGLDGVFAWNEVLMNLALKQTHPVLTAKTGSLSVHQSDEADGRHSLVFADYWITVRSQPDDHATTALMLKKLAKAKSYLREIRCGILRGSAYAIDWILDEYVKA